MPGKEGGEPTEDRLEDLKKKFLELIEVLVAGGRTVISSVNEHSLPTGEDDVIISGYKLEKEKKIITVGRTFRNAQKPTTGEEEIARVFIQDSTSDKKIVPGRLYRLLENGTIEQISLGVNQERLDQITRELAPEGMNAKNIHSVPDTEILELAATVSNAAIGNPESFEQNVANARRLGTATVSESELEPVIKLLEECQTTGEKII